MMNAFINANGGNSMNMKMVTAIAIGFMADGRSFRDVVQLTVDFLERKVSKQELRAIHRAYNKFVS